ncbi:hypothetical protein CANARDRAFT_27763 [[Candida] arabinofermentans NRRL YB-2248]|uniref:Signal recognition particle subunit SRP72 n=1 Tax=[Candida] arabinofermentans NRRL YB-2248 TaxID=983967 RepID=A0A1E4T1M9_9ASCO|nr:hypothetical protein CANARDRAFT_27763 [[Candida] arabinofermentans NRRL YB-2248]
MSSLTDLLSNLKVYSKNDSHSQVYELGLSILKKDPTNLPAFKKCLIALINMDKYQKATELMKNHPNLAANDEALLLEKAYVFYKLNDSESLSKLVSIGTSNRGFQNILAQHYYRIGRTEESLSLYQSLLPTSSAKDEGIVDLRVNEKAVLSQLKKMNGPVSAKLQSTNTDLSYDEIFNNALIKISENDYKIALVLLENAYEQCNTVLDDYDEQEKFEELTPIKIQIAYVKQLLGQKEEAEEILNQFDLNSLKDPVFKLIILNNLLSLKAGSLEDSNTALLYRELQFPNSLNLLSEKLILPQIKTLERNQLLLGLKAGKNVTKAAKKHQEQFNGSLLPSALSTLSKIPSFDVEELNELSNEKILFKYARSHPEDLPVSLLATQFSINAGKFQNAAVLIEEQIARDVGNLTKPSLVCLLLSIYDQLERKTAKSNILFKVYDEVLMKEFNNIEELRFLKFIAFELMSIDDEKSRQLFTKVQNVTPDDELVSMILGSSNTTDLLGSIEPLIESIDVDQLISEGITPLLSSKTSTSTLKSNSKSAKTKYAKVTKKARSKPKRLPKDLTKKIDEERWLPMKDRSYYKPKKGKKKDTQGGAVDASVESALNIANTTSTPAVVTPARKSVPAKKGKKKGKK